MVNVGKYSRTDVSHVMLVTLIFRKVIMNVAKSSALTVLLVVRDVRDAFFIISMHNGHACTIGIVT